MLRRLCSVQALPTFGVLGSTSFRYLTSYDTKPLSHHDVRQVYGGSKGVANVTNPHEFAEKSLIPALEAVEERVAMWRLNRWELRIPALLTGVAKERAQQQLHQIRKHMTEQVEIIENMQADKEVLLQSLGLANASELVGKDRAWLQEKVDALRWEGRVADAKRARDAWIRLEKYGSRDFRLMERICAVYAMARLNTFGDAFSNFVVEDPKTKALVLESQNPFQNAMSLIVSGVPTVDICYEFLGLGGDGYINGLKRYLRHVLLSSRHSPAVAQEAAESSSAARILYSSASEVLFDLTGRGTTDASPEEASHGVGDLLFYSQGKAVLIGIASPNRHQRSLQVPSRRQLEGISRRLCLTLDIPVENIKIQFLYLPPTAMDVGSLNRLHRAVGLTDPVDSLVERGCVPEWAALYDRELPASESDYVEIQKKFPEEEWVML